MPDLEAFRHLLHHHPELIDASAKVGTAVPAGMLGIRDADVIAIKPRGANFSSRLCG
jgi:hypothetical protein